MSYRNDDDAALALADDLTRERDLARRQLADREQQLAATEAALAAARRPPRPKRLSSAEVVICVCMVGWFILMSSWGLLVVAR
jgi:hypothetical protein